MATHTMLALLCLVASVIAANATLLSLLSLDVNTYDQSGGYPSRVTGGNGICPVDDDDYSMNGCPGAIVDSVEGWTGKGTRHLLYQFFDNNRGYSGCKSASSCRDLCKTWPWSPKGLLLSSISGENGLCAHWSWNGNSDCYLYGCGVCNSVESFDSKATFGSKKCSSGSGPGFKYCASGIKGDPHLHGADGSNFDFTGTPGNNYCLISDAHVHVNAYYGGRYDTWGNATKPLTWIRRVGILWSHHTVELVAREGARWRYGKGYMARMEVDGEPVFLSQEGDSVSSAGGAIRIRWAAAKKRDGDDLIDIYEVNVGNVMLLRLNLRPEVPNLRTPTDGVVHFDVEFPMADLSKNAHGVLGQTYRPDHKGRIFEQELEHNDQLGVDMVKGLNAEGFLDGSVDEYKSSGLLKADCKFARFVRAASREEETSSAIEVGFSSAISSTIPRKFLGRSDGLAL